MSQDAKSARVTSPTGSEASVRELVNEGIVGLFASAYVTDEVSHDEANYACIRALVDEAERRGGWLAAITSRDEYDGPYHITATGYLHFASEPRA